MKCLKCGHTWKRTKLIEYVSFASKCPKCGSRWLVRSIFGGERTRDNVGALTVQVDEKNKFARG